MKKSVTVEEAFEIAVTFLKEEQEKVGELEDTIDLLEDNVFERDMIIAQLNKELDALKEWKQEVLHYIPKVGERRK